MAKGFLESLIDSVLDDIFDDEWKGKYGEKLTERELKWVQLFGRKGKILRNVYLPKDNGETSEVDVVFITQKGIFVFESKNYSGWIFGNENDNMWTVCLSKGVKNRFYNPIKQNKTHLKWMRMNVGADIPLFSIIAFSERCELKKVTVYSPDIKVIKRDRTYATVREIWDSHPDVVSEFRVEQIYSMLKGFTNVTASVKVNHVNNINNKYKDNNFSNQANTYQNSANGYKSQTNINQNQANGNYKAQSNGYQNQANKSYQNRANNYQNQSNGNYQTQANKSYQNQANKSYQNQTNNYQNQSNGNYKNQTNKSYQNQANNYQNQVNNSYQNFASNYDTGTFEDLERKYATLSVEELRMENELKKKTTFSDADTNSTFDSSFEELEKKYSTLSVEELIKEKEVKNKNVPEKICPRCGNKLVIRTAKKGYNAGNQFYGCSTFPKCRYIENIK